jgi:hypothetical protein
MFVGSVLQGDCIFNVIKKEHSEIMLFIIRNVGSGSVVGHIPKDCKPRAMSWEGYWSRAGQRVLARNDDIHGKCKDASPSRFSLSCELA